MRYVLTGCLLLVALVVPVPADGEEMPGVWFLDGETGAADQRRLVVGGTVTEPPPTAEGICLGWSWRDPGPDVDLYPDAVAGTFLEPSAVWSLTAGGETVAPGACRTAEARSAFPRLGLGPADELWLLVAPEARQRHIAHWADLLHAIEAAYRQSTSSPLGAQTIGDLAGCAVRSLPVALDTQLDRWSPVELAAGRDAGVTGPEDGMDDAGGRRDELIRTRRFSWWLESPTGARCTTENGQGTLRLFPVPAAAAADAGTGDATGSGDHFLTIAGVDWQRLSFSALDPDDWSPRLRGLLPAPAPDATTATANREISIRPSPEQRQTLLGDRALDLCAVEGLAELCARDVRARRQLYTVIPPPDAEIPWPEEHLLKTQEACRAALANAGAGPTACTAAELWQRPIAGGLVAGFRGEVVLAERPAIRETWRDGSVEWRLDTGGGDLRQALAGTPVVELSLLDGSRALIATRELLAAPARQMAPWQWWALGSGALLALAALSSWMLARRDARNRLTLERLIESAVDRRLRPLGPPASSVPADDPDARQLSQVIADRLRSITRDIEGQAAAEQERLTAVAQELEEQLRQSSKALGDELRGSLLHEAQSLSQGLRQDLDADASPFQTLCHELDRLPDGEREPITAALAAAAALGEWIDRLWPVLEAAAGRDLESIPRGLSDPATGEWRRAVQTLDVFCHSDGAVFRLIELGATASPGPRETTLLEDAGLLAAGRPVTERLKRYLEPFDHIGRLGEVTLALQYLVEAFPIEQLSKDQRARWRSELAEAHRAAGLEEDFHQLVVRVAAGIGLRYRPVGYYKSRTDQSEYAFVRQQVSPISLSERVGFEATTDKATIVRLERPFFFQLDTGIYYAGHAHVARG